MGKSEPSPQKMLRIPSISRVRGKNYPNHRLMSTKSPKCFAPGSQSAKNHSGLTTVSFLFLLMFTSFMAFSRDGIFFPWMRSFA